MAVQKELMSVPDFSAPNSDDFFGAEKKALTNVKKAILMTAGAAVQKFMQGLEKEQEIIMNAADMLIELFVANRCCCEQKELLLLKAKKLVRCKLI
jgi:hypothetical protein